MTSQAAQQIGGAVSSPAKTTRRRWLAAAGAAIGAAVATRGGLLAQEATPIATGGATPVAVRGEERNANWVGTWSAAVHPPFPGFGEMPSSLIALDGQTLRQIVRATRVQRPDRHGGGNHGGAPATGRAVTGA